MKVVFDTSVLIAAFLKRSFSDRVLRRCLRRDFELYTSNDILDELEHKLRTKFHVPEKTARAFIKFIENTSTVVKPSRKPHLSRTLQGDAHLFACTKKVDADILVTLDRALLKMKRFGRTAVLHPRTLLWTFPNRNNTK